MAGTISSITISPGEKKTIVLQGRKDGWTPSPINDPNATYTYKVYLGQTGTPAIEPGADTPPHHIETEFSITCTTSNATIYYTTDGEEPVVDGVPAEAAQEYHAPFTLDSGAKTIKAAAICEEGEYTVTYYPSATATEVYADVTDQCATPKIVDGEDGTFTITCDYPNGASIYYNIGDGTQNDPTDASTLYTEAVTLEETRTVKAIAYKTDWVTSAVATSQEIVVSDLDEATEALIAAQEIDEVTPYSEETLAAIDDTIKALKAELISEGPDVTMWDILDSIYFLADIDTKNAATTLYNAKNPSNNVAYPYDIYGHPPTFDTVNGKGWTSEAGQMSCLMTDINPATAGGNFAQNSGTLFGYVRTAVTGNNAYMLIYQSARTNINPRRGAGGASFGINNQTTVKTSVSTSTGTGLWVATRTGAAAADSGLYRNGSLFVINSYASEAMTSGTLQIGGRSDASSGLADGIYCLAGHGGGMTSDQVSAFNTIIMTNYITPLGLAAPAE